MLYLCSQCHYAYDGKERTHERQCSEKTLHVSALCDASQLNSKALTAFIATTYHDLRNGKVPRHLAESWLVTIRAACGKHGERTFDPLFASLGMEIDPRHELGRMNCIGMCLHSTLREDRLFSDEACMQLSILIALL